MFHSCIFEDYGFDLQREIQKRQEDIVDCYCDLWHDNGDEIYDGLFRYFFPAGFIDRDKERAKKIIRDLRDIVYSPTIRRNSEAIYCFVMYHMIEAWYEYETSEGIDLLPEDVEEYLLLLEEKKKGLDEDEAEDLSQQVDDIRGWFTDGEECLIDFRNAYDQDYMDESMAEDAAEAYLEFGFVPESWGVDIRELIDLLPNDLYEKVVKKLGEEATDISHQIIVACESISNNALDYKEFGENAINRRVRDHLRGSLKGYEVLDQSHQGFGENSKEEGSLDILIKKDGLNEAIYEGLIHEDYGYLKTHIKKAIERYNPSGCRKVYIGEYYKNKRFGVCWKNTVRRLNAEYSGIDVDTRRNGICEYQFEVENLFGKTTICIIGVNMGA